MEVYPLHAEKHPPITMTKKERTVLIHLALANLSTQKIWSLQKRIQYAQTYLNKMYTRETIPDFYRKEYGNDALGLDIWCNMSLLYVQELMNQYPKQWKREHNNIKQIIS